MDDDITQAIATLACQLDEFRKQVEKLVSRVDRVERIVDQTLGGQG